MTIEKALEYASKGEAILFLGSGFSVGAKNVKSYDFKTGNGLNELLCSHTGLPKETPLEDSSEEFARKAGVDELIKLLKQEYVTKDIAEYHKTIAQVPWYRVYTTNYDNVFETASAQVGRAVTPISPNAEIHLTPMQSPLCIHLNGYIHDLDRTTIWESFKLTDTSYATASIEGSDWAALLRNDIKYARSVFFIGYSLFDLDIKRILMNQNDLNDKTFFVLYDGVDRVTESRAARYGNITKVGTSGLAKQILDNGYNIPQLDDKISIGRSIIEVLPTKIKRQAKDDEFIDLLMIGEFSHELTRTDENDKNQYYSDRPILEEIAERFDEGKIDLAILHSNIGNGKTISTKLISEILLERSYKVYEAKEITEYAQSELRALTEVTEKAVLIIDDYVSWLDKLKEFSQLIGDQFKIVVTARSNSHDIFEEKLSETFPQLKIEEFRLDTLSAEEIDWWINALNNYGFWGDLAGAPYNTKMKFIVDKCNRQIHGILLKVMESPFIHKKLSNAAINIKSDPIVEKICIAIFALTSFGKKPNIDLIHDIWGVSVFDKIGIKNNSGILNFIDLTRSTIRVRSSVASEYLLKNYWDAETIINVLIEIVETVDEFYRVSDQYKELFKELIRFGNIQNALPDKGKREAVISYYDSLKSIGRNKTYPLFWLQYAIATLVIGDLERSERYFKTAYSYAEKKGWDTYQIDNHYARFLLVMASETMDLEESFEFFIKARTLINRQISDNDNMYYPFRVAASYQLFYDRFESKFTSSMLQEIYEGANTVASRIEELPTHRTNHKSVRLCRESMLNIMARVSRKLEAS